jgi:DNA repair protein RecN (Recombination protein N)
MLLGLNLKNFTIIDDISVSFTSGLNIITGETGAGKSIIVDAVNIILGEKVTPDLIKTGEDESRIEALFDISSYPVIKERLLSSGFDASGDELLIKRVIYRKGRSRVHMNGETATLSILEHVTEGLIDVFSQHEHQTLLKRENHLRVLDELGGNGKDLERVRELYGKHSEVRTMLRQMSDDVRDLAEKEDFLKFQLDEIQKSSLRLGEDEELEAEKLKLLNIEKLLSASKSAYEEIYENEPSLSGRLKSLTAEISEAGKIDEPLSKIASLLESAIVQIEDASFTLRDYASELSFESGRLDEIEERLKDISELKRKYGGTISNIFKRREEIEKELSAITNHDEQLEELRAELREIEKSYNKAASELSEKRKRLGVSLGEVLQKELSHVGIKGAQFSSEFKQKEMSPDGVDDVTFLFSANPDEAPKPLARVASGGELSRIMLVLKEAIARTEGGSIIIFDEADSGIGGAVAETVGEKIKKLSEPYQVICITHLPQVAKFGDSHLLVSKTLIGGKTRVSVRSLNEQERVQELARMIGGLKVTQKTLDAAHEMLGR